MAESNRLPGALIFDMDGVLVDSNPFHVQKWAEFLDEHGIRYTREELTQHVLGHHNDHAFQHFFQDRYNDEEITRLGEEIEARFRKAFHGHAQPFPGLEAFLAECHAAAIPMAVASSAMLKNVEFVVDELGFRPYFRCLFSADHVEHPKPDPEIYLRVAEELGIPPAFCIAFEDSTVGIESVKRAGMTCVAIASTFSAQELQRHGYADHVAAGFQELNLKTLRQLSAL